MGRLRLGRRNGRTGLTTSTRTFSVGFWARKRDGKKKGKTALKYRSRGPVTGPVEIGGSGHGMVRGYPRVGRRPEPGRGPPVPRVNPHLPPDPLPVVEDGDPGAGVPSPTTSPSMVLGPFFNTGHRAPGRTVSGRSGASRNPPSFVTSRNWVKDNLVETLVSRIPPPPSTVSVGVGNEPEVSNQSPPLQSRDPTPLPQTPHSSTG